MNKILKNFLIILSLIIVLFYLSGCNSSKDNKNDLGEKIHSEISYIDSELISIANGLNGISYTRYKVNVNEIQSLSKNSEEENAESNTDKKASEEKNAKESGKEENGSNGNSEDSSTSNSSSSQSGSEDKQDESEESAQSGKNENEEKKSPNKIFSMKSNDILGQVVDINWSELRNKVENLYTSWTTVTKDLKEIGVSTEQLNDFNKCLDRFAVAVKNENKTDTVDCLISMYEHLPKFAEIYGDDKEKNILSSKYCLLICYKCVDIEDWDQLEHSLGMLKMTFSNILNKKSEYGDKQVNIDNAMIILNEMEDSLEIKDKEVFFIKYKNLMQELNMIFAM